MMSAGRQSTKATLGTVKDSPEKARSALNRPIEKPSFIWQRLATHQHDSSYTSKSGSSSSVNSRSTPVQAKLKIGSEGDSYEKEADEVADRVAALPSADQGHSALPQNQSMNVSSSYHTQTDTQSSGGAAVDASIRVRAEQVLGTDLSKARVHNDQGSHDAASQIHARAFTIGNHIYLGRGESKNDSALMAHELTHTVQQNAANTVRRQASQNPVLSPAEMLDIISRERAWTFNRGGQVSVDTRGVGRGVGAAAGGRRAGSAVFSAIQITDASGRPVELSYGDHIRYGEPHAEQRAVGALERRIPQVRDLRGGRMTVVLDQVPCPPGRQDCMGLLQRFARQRGLTLEIHLPTRERMRGSGSVAPRTAAMSTMRTDTPAVSLQRFYPDGNPPQSGGGGGGGVTTNQRVRARAPIARLLPPQAPSRSAVRARLQVVGELAAETRRSTRMTSRINLATKGVTGLLGVLGAISTARNFQQMYVHGTIFPDAERKAEQVVQLGSEIKEWAIDTTNNISLMGIIASISEADSREDISSLTDIEDSLDQIYPDLQDRGRRFGEYARSLRAREAGLGVMKDFFRNLVSVPMGGSTAPNAEAFAMSESLGRLQSVVQRAAVNFESAHTQMQYYGDYLEGLALRANRMSWAIIFTNAAILTNEIERERQLETSIEHERNLNSLSTALTGIDAELNSPICHSDEAEANLRSRREALVSQIELARRANVH